MKAFPHVGKLRKIRIGHDRPELSMLIVSPSFKSFNIFFYFSIRRIASTLVLIKQ